MENSRGKKIAFLLPNPCNPDYRVIKHAEAFARNGYEVRMFCRWQPRLPWIEVVNGVTYVRRPITSGDFIYDLGYHLANKFGIGVGMFRNDLEKARQQNKEHFKELEF